MPARGDENRWLEPPARLELAPNTADVWRVVGPHDDAHLEALAALLEEPERARAQRFKVDLARRRFIAARGSLRRILSHYVDTGPAALRFRYGEHGKPYLAGDDARRGIEFNLTDSNEVVLCAVLEREVGLDIERVRTNLDCQKLATRYFAPGEAARLATTSGEARTEAFFRCWTRKEAYLKYKGAGLTFPLRRFEVSFLADEAPALLATEIPEDDPARLSLVHLVPHPGMVAALCTEGPAPALRRWELAPPPVE